jgi:hypothetical protein
MGITVSWDNESKTATRYDFQGRWTWDEFRRATVEAFALTSSVTHRVDSISYFHKGADLPSNALFHFSKAMKDAPTNRGMTIIVGGTVLINNLVSIFSKVYKPLGARLMLAHTLEEARQKLAAKRPQSAEAVKV